MKVSALREWLFKQSDLLEKACRAERASDVRRLADLLAARSNSSVTEICKILQAVKPASGKEPSLGNISELLTAMAEAACIFAKSADAKDLRQFVAVIEGKREHSLDAFLQQATEALIKRSTRSAPSGVSEEVLRSYLKRLEEALGDEQGFEEVYQQLQADTRLKALDFKKLAKSFVGKSGKSKTDALGLIYGRHKSLISARAAAGSTGRRLAG
jgi:hypothetical protein